MNGAVRQRINDGKLLAGKTREQRYGWNMTEHPHFFEEIHKDKITFDYIYQREEDCADRSQAIARDFRWSAFGAICVSRRDGMNFCFDGRTRTFAARLRSDVVDLPCLVFVGMTINDEARAFVAIQRQRRMVTAIQQYRAACAYEDPAALFIRDLAAGCRYSINASVQGRCVKCVAYLQDCARWDRDVLARVWPLVVDLSDGGPIHHRVIAPIFWIERELRKRGGGAQTLTAPPFPSRLKKMGAGKVIEAGQKAAAYHSKGSVAIWAKGLVMALNNGLRTSKLRVAGVGDEDPDGVEIDG
jgi:hypothetical protein